MVLVEVLCLALGASAIFLEDSTTLTTKVVRIAEFVFLPGAHVDVAVLETSPQPTDPSLIFVAVCLSDVVNTIPAHYDEDTQCTKIKNACDYVPFNASMSYRVADAGTYQVFFLLCSIPNYLKITYSIHLYNPHSELSADEMYRPTHWLVVVLVLLLYLLFAAAVNTLAARDTGRLQLGLLLVNACFLACCVFRAVYWKAFDRSGRNDGWLAIVADLFAGLGCASYLVLLTFVSQGYRVVFRRTPLLQAKFTLLLFAGFTGYQCAWTLLSFVTWTKLFADVVLDVLGILLLAASAVALRSHPALHPVELERNTFIQTRNRQLHFASPLPSVPVPRDPVLLQHLRAGAFVFYAVPDRPLSAPPPRAGTQHGLAAPLYN